MNYKNFLATLVLFGTTLAPAAVLAQDSNERNLYNLRMNFLSDARRDEKLMKNLFASESKTHTVSITGVVTANNGSLLSVTVGKKKVYAVDAANATITRYSGAAAGLGEIALKDIVTVRGTLEGNTITATSVRDVSLRIKNAQFYGTIVSLSAANTSFVLNTDKNGQQTVQLTSTSSIKKNGTTMTFNDLVVGQKVYVVGKWNMSTHVVTPTVVEIINRWNAIFIQGTVTAKAGNTLTVKRATGINYTVDLNRGMVVSRFYNVLTLDNVNIGDTILVGGIHLNDATDIQAFIVRDNTNTTGSL